MNSINPITATAPARMLVTPARLPACQYRQYYIKILTFIISPIITPISQCHYTDTIKILTLNK